MFDTKKLRIIDIEGTNSIAAKSELVELSVGFLDDAFELHIESKLYRPKSPIPPEASAVHNISNRMVADAPTVVEDYVGFTDLLFGPAAKDFIRETVFISHNAKYDYEVVNQYADLNSSLKTHWICTLRLAKHVLGPHHDKIQYSLGYLRYYLDLDVDDALTLHRADMDVAVCWQLFLKLLELAIDEGKVDPTQDVLKQCIDLCWQPLMIQTWPFGKHRGEKLSAIPLSYFSWALDNLNSLKEDSPEFDSDLASSVAQTVEQILSREK